MGNAMRRKGTVADGLVAVLMQGGPFGTLKVWRRDVSFVLQSPAITNNKG